MGAWTINGRSFEMEGYANDEIVKLNTLEVWEFTNQTNSMSAMAHPMHIHGVPVSDSRTQNRTTIRSRHGRPCVRVTWMKAGKTRCCCGPGSESVC